MQLSKKSSGNLFCKAGKWDEAVQNGALASLPMTGSLCAISPCTSLEMEGTVPKTCLNCHGPR